MRSRVETRKTGEIAAQDERGNRYTILRYTEFHATPTSGSPEGEVQGLDIYRLPDGDYVNKISDNEFYAVLGDVRLTPI